MIRQLIGRSMRKEASRMHSRCGRRSIHRLSLESLEERTVLSVDFLAGPLTVPTNRIDIGLGPFNNFEEPMIAVNNRVDPGNIAISSHNDMIVSSDFFVNTATSTFPAANRGDTWHDFDTQGRLFWTNLDATGNTAVGVTQVNPITAVPTASVIVDVPPGSQSDDRQALAADSFPESPYHDNIYTIWTRFGLPSPPSTFGTEVFIGASNDQGQTWTVNQVGDSNGPDNIPGNGDDEGFGQQVNIITAPNGDVYGAYHAQPGFNNLTPDGVSGHIVVVRSTDGGTTFTQKTQAFLPGQADITFNRQEGSTAGQLTGAVSDPGIGAACRPCRPHPTGPSVCHRRGRPR